MQRATFPLGFRRNKKHDAIENGRPAKSITILKMPLIDKNILNKIIFSDGYSECLISISPGFQITEMGYGILAGKPMDASAANMVLLAGGLAHRATFCRLFLAKININMLLYDSGRRIEHS